MKTVKTLLISCLVTGVLAMGATAADADLVPVDIKLVPISASGSHSFVCSTSSGTVCVDDDDCPIGETCDHIILDAGGQRVWLEIFISGWTPNLLYTWQVELDSSGYSSGNMGTLGPASVPCTGDAECIAAFAPGAKCGYPVGVNTHCTPGFIDSVGRADYIFASVGDMPAVDLYQLDFRYGSFTMTALADGGGVYYAGHLILDVPIGAIGTFTVDLKPDPGTWLKDPQLYPIVPVILTPAEITVPCQTAGDCDDGNLCTTDACNTGVCEYTNNTLPCDDGLYCTVDEACSGGECTGGSARDCSDGIGCTTDSCDEINDECDHDLDPGFCFITGTCRTEGEDNPANDCEECNTQLSTSSWSPKPIDASCGSPDDTDCDNPDTCDGAGNCQDNYEPPGTLCGDQTDDDCTDPDTCDGNGNCEDNHEPPGTPCGDPTDTDCDNPDTCNGNGTCLDNCEPNGSSCDDGLYCNVNETCLNCDCTGGNPRDCSDGIPCTTDSCDEINDECDHDLDSGFCLIAGICRNEGQENPANECEECNTQLSTTSWSPKPIDTSCGSPDDTDCDNPDTCDGAGNCQDNYEPPGTLCGDQTDDDCTDPDTCDGNGNCEDNHEPPGTPCGDPTDTDCDNPDTCDGNGTCLDNCESNGTSCDDGLYCNVGETCLDCDCTGGDPRNCSDGIPCTTDWCNEDEDQCENDLDPGFCLIAGICRNEGQENPANECEECNTALSTTNWSPKSSGVSCGDPDDTDCTNPDTCDGSGNCDDNHEPPGWPCDDPTDTDCDNPDTCNGNGTCLDNCEPNGTSCDDGLYCNINETCLNCDCTGGSARNCSDGVPCTDDWCDEVNDVCVHDEDDAYCNNLQFCDGIEICDDVLNCITQPGSVPDCDDQIDCTNDWCNEGMDRCENDPIDANCNDGQYCNGVEVCDPDQDCITQPGSIPNCDDTIGCTDDSCDEDNDECDNVPNDAHCPDDEEFCNGTEYCNPETDCDHTGNPCAGPCDPILGCLCETPVVDYDIVNPRYIPIALQPPESGPQAIVLTVECVGGPVVLYAGEPVAVDLDNDHVDDEMVAFVTTDSGSAAWRTPEEWGELYVTGELIVPDTTYTVQGDCGQPGSPGLSDPTAVTTAIWGDVVGDYVGGVWTAPNGVVDFVDISSVVERFKNIPYAPPINRAELCGPNGNECRPSQRIDFVDILSCVEAFRGITYQETWVQCPVVCP